MTLPRLHSNQQRISVPHPQRFEVKMCYTRQCLSVGELLLQLQVNSHMPEWCGIAGPPDLLSIPEADFWDSLLAFWFQLSLAQRETLAGAEGEGSGSGECTPPAPLSESHSPSQETGPALSLGSDNHSLCLWPRCKCPHRY